MTFGPRCNGLNRDSVSRVGLNFLPEVSCPVTPVAFLKGPKAAKGSEIERAPMQARHDEGAARTFGEDGGEFDG